MPAKVDKVEKDYSFEDKVFKIITSDRCGLYDVETKRTFIPVVYKNIVRGWEDRVIVSDNFKKYYVVNYKNEEIIKASDYIFPTSYNNKRCFAVCRNEKWGILDYNGKELLPFIYDTISEYLEKYLVYGFEGEYVLYNIAAGAELCREDKEIRFNEYYFYTSDRWVYVDADAKWHHDYEEDVKHGRKNGDFVYPL